MQQTEKQIKQCISRYGTSLLSYLMACSEELAHFVVVLSTLQGQVPCSLHEPHRLSFPGGRGGKGAKLLFCTLDVGKHAMQRTPGGRVEGRVEGSVEEER